MTKSSTEKKEKIAVQILATKFHTNPVDELGAGK
jgi:hypothetical protein